MAEEIKDNWYLVLELEFDPDPVMDEAVIAQKIEEKSKLWSRKANDLTHGAQYRRYTQMLPQIKAEMLGPENKRAELAADACRKVYGPVDSRLKQIGKKEIPREMVEKIAKKDKVSEEVIIRRAKALGITIGAGSGEDYQKLYDTYYKEKPQNTDKFNGMRQMLDSFHVKNLYEFLAQGGGASAQSISALPTDALTQKAKELKTSKYHKNDAVSGSGSKLCGLCGEIFQNESTKELYDHYLEYSRRKEILDGARELYDITSEITDAQYRDVIGKLTELTKDPRLAERIFTAFCKVEKLPVAMGGGAGKIWENPNIKVCRCGCINDVSDGRTLCKVCGRPLQIKCPKCGKLNDANIRVCACGFRFENLDKADALCDAAEAAIHKMEFEAAAAHLADAEKYWPKSSRAQEVRNELARKEEQVGPSVRGLKKARSEKRYFEARKYLETLKNFFPEFEDAVLEEEIEGAIRLAQEYRDKAKGAADEEAAVEACAAAYEACHDCPGVQDIIKKYPPLPPANLQISTDAANGVNMISWTASPTGGLISYIVVRRKDMVPGSPQDGTLVGRVSMTSVMDRNIEAGAAYYYAVFAERADVFSKPLTAGRPTVNLVEISGVVLTAGDASMQLTWKLISDNATVAIERVEEGKNVPLPCMNRSSFVDRNLVNDKKYTYHIYLKYKVGMGTQDTRGITISGTPTCPPKAIEQLIVKPVSQREFEIIWENPENEEIQFFCSTKKPEYISGDMISLETLEREMKPLFVRKSGACRGTFTYEQEELLYIVAAAVKKGLAVTGAIARANRGGDVKIKNINLVNGRILIRADVPKNATGFVVLYRNDHFPEELSDREAVRRYIPLKQYQYDSGLYIDANEPKNYYFSVYAEFNRDGDKDYSAGTDQLFACGQKEVITYSVSVGKKLFGGSVLTLTFQAENRKFDLPDIDIMSSVGVAPMFKKSAFLFHEIEGRKVDGTAEIKIKLDKLPKDTYIKAFLRDESLADRYQLKLKLKSNLKIS